MNMRLWLGKIGCPRKGGLSYFRNCRHLILLGVLALGQHICSGQATNNSPVLVELFTAEGCSSCPAADKLLGEMTTILEREGIQVIGLSFHVTYWNKYGWRDPFSQDIFTNRQKEYVKKLSFTQVEKSQVYTPQAVINGTMEFVGSNPFKFRENAIMASQEVLPLKIDARMTRGDSIRIEFTFNKSPRNNILNVAVVEHMVESHVTRGENKDRVLIHQNVVRSYRTIVPEKQGAVSISWPAGLSPDKGSIVLFTQQKSSYKVTGIAILK